MPQETTKEELTERSQLVRLYEASCKIAYPNEKDVAFRFATQVRLAKLLGITKPGKKEVE